MKALVTGGTGHLGEVIVTELTARGHEVRVLARAQGRVGGVEWFRGDLSTGAGVEDDAVAGVDVVVHAATNSPAARRGGFRPADFVRSPTDVDIDGTKLLLASAERHGIEHFVHVSLAGLQHMARINPYSRVKLAAEEIVRGSPVPWSIVRATGFYWLLDRLLARIARRRALWLPAGVRMQPVDSDGFAAFVVAVVDDGRRGEHPDFAGPQAHTMHELAEQYLADRGLDRRIRSAPLPRRVKHALDAGNTPAAAVRGERTWRQWLQLHPAEAGRPEAGTIRL
jgi:uncharacterized protein YbjT (DUF2867 family)